MDPGPNEKLPSTLSKRKAESSPSTSKSAKREAFHSTSLPIIENSVEGEAQLLACKDQTRKFWAIRSDTDKQIKECSFKCEIDYFLNTRFPGEGAFDSVKLSLYRTRQWPALSSQFVTNIYAFMKSRGGMSAPLRLLEEDLPALREVYLHHLGVIDFPITDMEKVLSSESDGTWFPWIPLQASVQSIAVEFAPLLEYAGCDMGWRAFGQARGEAIEDGAPMAFFDKADNAWQVGPYSVTEVMSENDGALISCDLLREDRWLGDELESEIFEYQDPKNPLDYDALKASLDDVKDDRLKIQYNFNLDQSSDLQEIDETIQEVELGQNLVGWNVLWTKEGAPFATLGPVCFKKEGKFPSHYVVRALLGHVADRQFKKQILNKAHNVA